MKTIFALCFLAFAIVPGNSRAQSAAVSNDPPAMELTGEFINQLAEEARTNNPALQAAAARFRAAVASEQSVPLWEDPEIEIGGMVAERRMRMEEGDLVYGAEQKLPLFGKPQAERRLAGAEARVMEAEADATFQQLRRDIALAVFRAALVQRTVEIAEQDLAWLDTQVSVVGRRYETGDATQVDVLRVENERAQRETRLEIERDLLEHEHLNLNRLLNRPLDAPWPELRLPAVAGAVAYSPKLVELALRNEPELKTRREQIQQAEAAVDVARRARYPDVAAGAELRQYSGSGEPRQGMVTLSFSLPWGNSKRYQAAIRREQEKLRATELETADFELGLRDEIHELVTRIEAGRREAVTYRDEIIPRSEIALESARAAWEGNRGMFRDVLEARRMLLDAQLMYARAVTEQYQMMANLVLCCGLGDLEALQMIGAFPGAETQPESPSTNNNQPSNE